MDMLLIVVSLVSLAIATGMSVIAWRLAREGRLRSAARVEALETLAFAEPPAAPRPAPVQPRFSALDDDRAPVAHDDGWDAPQPGSEAMFVATAGRAAPPRRWLALAAVAGMMALGAGTVYALRPSSGGSTTGSANAPAPVVAASTHPLELTSLQYSTEEPGYFTVSGLVHNPASAHSLHGIVAVVYLFDAQGQYLANARVPLDLAALDPGVDSPFTLRVAVSGAVARYRVGFRLPDGSVVPHVDRRAEPGAETPQRPKTESERVGL